MAKKHTLPDLPYDYGDLEPVISREIMELHHQKHHNAYVTKLNEALEAYEKAEASGDLGAMTALLKAIKFNGGGHINHSIFWTNLAPVGKGGGEPPTGPLMEAIVATYGSLEALIETFNGKAGPLQGSGWGWLVKWPKKKELGIVVTCNQDPVHLMGGAIPLLGIDVWEHAYYLQYKNARPEYLKNIWKVVNWKNVEERYNNA